MNKNFRIAVIALAVVVAGVAVWYSRSRPKASPAIALVYQSNRYGILEPCTCDMNPFGGIDREWNAIQEIKKNNAATLIVDAGNLLAPAKLTGTVEEARKKADFVASMVKETGLEVFAPGPADYALGVETVEKAAKTLGAELVSTNITKTKNGETLFSPYLVKEKSGVRFSFLSLSPNIPGFNRQAPEEALKKWLPEAKAKSDIVVLLSQLPMVEGEKILKSYPEINLVVGADPDQVFLDAVWYRNGGKLMVDPQLGGYYLGMLKIEPKLPLTGFYSQSRISKNLEKKQALEAKLAIPSEAAGAKSAIDSLERFEPLQALQGGSLYEHELIALSPQRYGQPNALTERMKQYKDQMKQSALNED